MMTMFWLSLWAASSGAVPPADALPASLMLGRTSTDTGRAFSRCRTHQPSPLVKACEVVIGGSRAVALFLYDSAQRVEQVDVVFPLQKARSPAAAQARQLRALNPFFAQPTAQEATQAAAQAHGEGPPGPAPQAAVKHEAIAQGPSPAAASEGKKSLTWQISRPHLEGRVRLLAQPRGWMVTATFRDPSFTPSYF